MRVRSSRVLLEVFRIYFFRLVTLHLPHLPRSGTPLALRTRLWPWHGPWSGVALERRFPRDLEYTRAGDEREQELAGQDGTQPTLRYLTK